MTMKLYDLAGAEDDRRFSPFCWRARLALAHKGLVCETVPWRFTEKDAIAFSGQDKVPVLVDGERVVSDSWAIALYLEDAYADRPTLFGAPAGRGAALFVKHWTEQVAHPLLARLTVVDIVRHLHPNDVAYFRESRQRRFGMSIEEFCRDRERVLPAFRKALDPLRETVRGQPFIAGQAAAFADYIAFGMFQWARCISDFQLLEGDDPVYAWRERMLDLFGGLARTSPGYPV